MAGMTSNEPVGRPLTVEDHQDFQSAAIVPGDRFDLTIATEVFRCAEFCGLYTEQSEVTGKLAIVGMRFRVRGEIPLQLRWVEIESLQPIK